MTIAGLAERSSKPHVLNTRDLSLPFEILPERRFSTTPQLILFALRRSLLAIPRTIRGLFGGLEDGKASNFFLSPGWGDIFFQTLLFYLISSLDNHPWAAASALFSYILFMTWVYTHFYQKEPPPAFTSLVFDRQGLTLYLPNRQTQRIAHDAFRQVRLEPIPQTMAAHVVLDVRDAEPIRIGSWLMLWARQRAQNLATVLALPFDASGASSFASRQG